MQDSALIYRNHHEVGQGIKDSGIPREEIFITSKIVSKFQGYEQTLAKVEESLVELNTCEYACSDDTPLLLLTT